MIKKYLVLLMCPLLLVGCQHQSEPTNTETDEVPVQAKIETGPIVIGGIGSLTGEAAAYGITDQNIVNLKIEQINQNGGINGRELQIIWEDGKCAPGDASKAAQKLINVDKVKIILGAVCSGETLAIAPISEKAEVILFSALSSSPEITDAGDFVFRTTPSDDSQAKVMANYANPRYKKIAVLHEQTDYAVAVANTFKKKYEGELIIESFLSTESDFKTRITKIKNIEGVDAIYLIPQSPNKGDIIIKQLAEQEVKLPIITNEVMAADPAIIAKHKEYIESIGGIVGADFSVPEDSVELQALLADYKTKYNEDPAFVSFAATAADRVEVLAKVLREVADVNDTKAIRDGLYATQGFNEGIIKNLSFDQNGDANVAYSLVKFNGETFAPFTE
ncbi:MAG TPA: ABC transporter substrate-binding protein [Candidatus Gracilibacteria bacterium]